jgi:hypothetical protein
MCCVQSSHISQVSAPAQRGFNVLHRLISLRRVSSSGSSRAPFTETPLPLSQRPTALSFRLRSAHQQRPATETTDRQTLLFSQLIIRSSVSQAACETNPVTKQVPTTHKHNQHPKNEKPMSAVRTSPERTRRPSDTIVKSRKLSSVIELRRSPNTIMDR